MTKKEKEEAEVKKAHKEKAPVEESKETEIVQKTMTTEERLKQPSPMAPQHPIDDTKAED